MPCICNMNSITMYRRHMERVVIKCKWSLTNSTHTTPVSSTYIRYEYQSLLFCSDYFSSETGCLCSHGHGGHDCACCEVGGCQCPGANHHQCSPCQSQHCGTRTYHNCAQNILFVPIITDIWFSKVK
jgi:hypothetical protein